MFVLDKMEMYNERTAVIRKLGRSVNFTVKKRHDQIVQKKNSSAGRTQ